MALDLVLDIHSIFKLKFMKKIIIITASILFYLTTSAQVNINRYSESKITLEGLKGNRNIDKEVVIPEVNTKEVFKRWENSKISKFAEPVMVDITPFEQGLWENSDTSVINRIKITASNANSISVYFDKLKLSKNAELYIYNLKGTVVTGPIRESENIGDNALWGSNVFNGTSIIIEFKCPTSEKNQNELHIKKILYGINPKLQFTNKDTTTGPGFGLSSTCNINAVCIAGWDAERRAIAQVVDEGGGWCSASLIMNTC
jgi:hypothetical protein